MCRQKLADPPAPFYVGSDRTWLSSTPTQVEVDVQDVSQIRVVAACLGGNRILSENPRAIVRCRPNGYSKYILAIYEVDYTKMVEIEFLQEGSDMMVKVLEARYYKSSEADDVHEGSPVRYCPYASLFP